MRRRVLFSVRDVDDGTPIPGATITDVMISPNGGFWRRSMGPVFDLGGGVYIFEVPRDDIDFVGTLGVSVRHEASGNPLVMVEIVPSDEHYEVMPPVWFTT